MNFPILLLAAFLIVSTYSGSENPSETKISAVSEKSVANLKPKSNVDEFSEDREYLTHFFSDRILGGRLANKGEIPFIVLISRAINASICGGSIVSNFHVLTACHCVVKKYTNADGKTIAVAKSHENFRVIAGSLSSSPPEDQGFQLRWILYWIPHPKCEFNNPKGILYDAGIVKVTEQFYWTECVQPASMPVKPQVFSKFVDKLIEGHHMCYTAGWGTTATKLVFVDTPAGITIEEKVIDVSRYLKMLDSSLLSGRVCNKILCSYHIDFIQKRKCVKDLTETGSPRLCSWSRITGNGTTCFGDSGGPLVCNGSLIGIVSYGRVCFPRNNPVVFARIDKMFSFVARYYQLSPWYSSGSLGTFLDVSCTVLICAAAYSAFIS